MDKDRRGDIAPVSWRRAVADPKGWNSTLEKAVLSLTAIFIFFGPIPHTTSIKEIAFYASWALASGLWIFRRRPFVFFTPMTIPLLVFFAWACAGIPFSLDPEETIHDLYSHFVRYLVFYWILLNFFCSKARIRALSWVLILSGVSFSMGGLIYYYGILGQDLGARFAGSLDQISPNLVGIATLFPIFLALVRLLTERGFRARIFLLLCLIPLSAATFMTQARGTFIALFLGLVLIFAKSWRPALMAIGTLSVGLFLLIFLTPIKDRFIHSPVPYDSFGQNIRLTIHHISLEVIKDYPLMGIGFGNRIYGKKIDWTAYNQRIPERYRLTPETRATYRDVINDPHNMFFSVAVRVGLVGFALFVSILLVFFRMAWINIRKSGDGLFRTWSRTVASGLLIFLVIGSFEPVFSHMQEVVLFTLFGMMSILWRLNQEERTGKNPSILGHGEVVPDVLK